MSDQHIDDGTAAEQTEESMGSAISGGSGAAGWFDHTVKGLTLAGIVALVGVTWKLSDTVTRIDTFLAAKVQQNDRDFARIDATLGRHDERLDRLEQQRRDTQRNADHK